MQEYTTLPDETRIWIYQSNRPFPPEEVSVLKDYVNRFAQNWVSHNRQLRAVGDVLFDRFIILMVDETQADASGCSIDKSVHFLKQVEQAYGVDLFDRLIFTWKEGDQVCSATRDEFSRLYAEGVISDETLVFDNLVKTKGDLEKAWLKPLGQSWHKRMI
jgi:hypothetical protein